MKPPLQSPPQSTSSGLRLKKSLATSSKPRATEAVNFPVLGATKAAAKISVAANRVSASAGELDKQAVMLKSKIEVFLRSVRAA
jgi:hypothetical protein